MVGGRQRRVASVYQRSQPIDGTGDEDLQMPSASSRRRGSNRRRRRQEEQPLQEEERVVTPEDEDKDEDEEVDEEAAGDTSSELPSVYLRGTVSLPQRPIPPYRRPKIAPDGEKSWTVVESAGCHTRSVSGILGLLLKAHFLGLVQFTGKEEPPYTFAHYTNAPDARDLLGREFPNKAERVKVELWDFFRCQDGCEDAAALVLTKACKRGVKDMHYEAHV